MILHLALPDDWAAATASGLYGMSTRGLTIEAQGFLHASFDDEQAARVAAHFYADVPALVRLEMDEDALVAAGFEVRAEPGDPSRPDGELFPHVYGGPIPVALLRASAWAMPQG